MFKERGKISTINKVLMVILGVVSILAIGIIMLLQINRKSIETNIQETQGVIENYATTEENSWDVSKNGDGSVTATLSADGTLTISGKGDMKGWSYDNTTDWHNSEINKNVLKVVINEGVTSIGSYAFMGCSSITSINIPEGVTSIGGGAFEECSSITSINISSSVTSIGNYAFSYCSSLTGIKVNKNNKNYKDENGVLYTKDGKEIIRYPSKKEGTTYTVPEGVTSIGWGAFEECSSLTRISIPEGVTSIGNCAFVECNSLTRVNIPEGVTSIGSYAFMRCSSLIEINIPEGVTNIGIYAFYGCKIPELVKAGDDIDLPNILKRALNEDDILYTSEEFGINNCQIKDNKVLINKNETYAKIEVKDGALKGITYIISYNEWDVSQNGDGSVTATLSSDGTLIISGKGDMKDWYESKPADWHISGIEKTVQQVIVNEGVTSIGAGAFCECINLTSIDMPEGLTSIGVGAFLECSNLTKIEIPGSVTNIGELVFALCSNLTDIKVKENNIKYKDENGVLYTKDEKEIIRYPEGKKDKKYIILKEVTSINIGAFYGCISLTSIDMPEGITSIGYGAFFGCISLTSMDIPEGVTSIDIYTFCECISLRNINIPKGITSIDEDAFWDCEATIICNNNSTALKYAQDNEIKYQIDDEGPMVNYSVKGITNPVKVIETTITITDDLAGVKEGSLKYLWSTESENITKEQIVNSFQNGETINIKDVTGTYYLWIYAKDKLGNESIVKSEEFLLDNTFEINGEYIIGIQPQTTYKKFKENITIKGEYKITEGDKEIGEKTIIKTGQKLKEENRTYTIVVIGDTNGDGQADIKDILQINKHRLNKAKLENEYLLAGDTNNDGKVEIRDILQINKYRLKKVSEL